MDCALLNKVSFLLDKQRKNDHTAIKESELKYSKYHIHNEIRNCKLGQDLLGERPLPLESSTFFNILDFVYKNFEFREINPTFFKHNIRDLYDLLTICFYRNSSHLFESLTYKTHNDLSLLNDKEGKNRFNVSEENKNYLKYNNKYIFKFNNTIDPSLHLSTDHMKNIIKLLLVLYENIVSNYENQNIISDSKMIIKEKHDTLLKMVYSFIYGNKNIHTLDQFPTVGYLIPTVIYAYKLIWFASISNFTVSNVS